MTKKVILRFLKKGKFHLNLLLIFFYLLRTLLWSGLIPGIILLVLRITGFQWATVLLWIPILPAGALSGLIIAWKNRVSLNDSARWLDSNLRTNEAFSAFLFLKEHESSGYTDAVIERAGSFIKNNIVINWPYYKLLKLFIITALVLISMSLLIILWFPKMHLQSAQREIPVNNTAHRSERDIRVPQKADAFSFETPEAQRNIAQMLFPRDEYLSMQAQEALQRGDYKTLEEMIMNYRSDKERSMNSKARDKQLERELKQQEWIAQMIYEKVRNREIDTVTEKEGYEYSQEEYAESININKAMLERNRENPGNETPDKNRKNGENDALLPYNQNEDLNLLSFGNDMDAFSGSDGRGANNRENKNSAGTGSVNGIGTWKDNNSNIPRDKLIIDNDKSPIIEYINPGKGTRIPLSEILPDIKKSAEAAVKREDMPAEYEDIIGSYFLELINEIK